MLEAGQRENAPLSFRTTLCSTISRLIRNASLPLRLTTVWPAASPMGPRVLLHIYICTALLSC